MVVCYSTATLSAMCQKGGNVIRHLVGDNLETFAREQGSEALWIGSEGAPEERFAKAFKAVKASRGWDDKFHLVVTPGGIRQITRARSGRNERLQHCLSPVRRPRNGL
jgi:hypothetical protein